MDAIEKYSNMIKVIIAQAKKEGIDIYAYHSQIGEGASAKIIDSGIAVGKDIMNGGEYERISTWKN